MSEWLFRQTFVLFFRGICSVIDLKKNRQKEEIINRKCWDAEHDQGATGSYK